MFRNIRRNEETELFSFHYFKIEIMAKIIYFETNGCSGHYPIGIDMTLTGEESRKWCECDNEV